MAVLETAATLGIPRELAAQGAEPLEAEPLTKAELVRMLSTRTYSPEELAALVRRSCLTFEPTARDRQDLRSLGASDEVMEAVDACVRDAPEEGGGAASDPAGVVVVKVQPADLTLRVGRSGSVTLEATRGGRPAGGVRLRLRGSADIQGWDGGQLSATTDSAGRASFSVPAGEAVRSYRFTIDAEGAPLAGGTALDVRVTSGPPRVARVSPSVVVLEEGRDTAASVRTTVTDAYGNPAPGVQVLLSDPSTGAGLMTDVTGPGGVVDFAIRPETLPGGGVIHVRADRRILARIEVLVTPSRSEPGGAASAEVERRRREVEREARAPPVREARTSEREEGVPERDARDDPIADAREAAVRGRTDVAIARYRAAIESDPDDVWPRLGLARVLDGEGHLREAEAAYRDVLDLAPGNLTARYALALIEHEPDLVSVSVSGGSTFDGAEPALREAELEVRPVRALRVWGRYDRSLGIHDIPLIRGPDEVDGYFGGAALTWPGRLLTTSVEAGRRVDRTHDLDQTTVRVEQSVLIPAGRYFPRLTGGAYLGRWSFRDDWMVYGRARLPIRDGVYVHPAVYVGSTLGTDATEAGPTAEREIRIELPIGLRSPDGWLIEPAAAVGLVEGVDEARTRQLYEARLLAEVLFAHVVGIRLFVRHQRAPGTDPFTVGTAGLRLRIR